jgi:hypothetical protein
MPRNSKYGAESGVLRACLDLLAAERIWWMRMNTGAMRTGTRYVQFGIPGTADILALVPGECKCGEITLPVWIECKSAKGRQSLNQQFFQREVQNAGHTYLLIRDVSELQEWLKKAK